MNLNATLKKVLVLTFIFVVDYNLPSLKERTHSTCSIHGNQNHGEMPPLPDPEFGGFLLYNSDFFEHLSFFSLCLFSVWLLYREDD